VSIVPRQRRKLLAANSPAANVVLSGTGLQQPTVLDWRERMLGWQGWLDLQLLRREAEAALAP
jgi:hypothetical protein